MKKGILFFVVLLMISPLMGADKKKFLDELNKILDSEYFESAGISLEVFNLTDSAEVISYDNKKLLHPASNMKVITTTTAMYFLGPDYTFTTTLAGTGEIRDEVYTGDLYFIGGLDPDFTTTDLQQFTNFLTSNGIKEIRGNIYADVSIMDSLYWGVGWMWDDDPGFDFPYMTPLIINDVSVTVYTKPGESGKPVEYSVTPYSKYYSVSNYAVTVAEDTSDLTVTRDWKGRTNEIQLKGFLSADESLDSTRINICRPELYFLKLFEEQLSSAGIRYYGVSDTLTSPENCEVLFRKTRKYENILDNLNKESDNLSAEMSLRALALESFGKPATAENGIKMIDSLIAIVGLDPEDYRIVDGSGVSHYNLVSTELMTRLLNFMYYKYPEKYQRLKISFPEAGVDGTLENRMTRSEAKSKIFAKTGTLSGVSTLSGYAECESGKNISFSIFVQNFVGKTSHARSFQDKICQLIVKYL